MKSQIKEIISYGLIIVSVVLIRTFIVTPVKVHGLSMYKTLTGNEICILNKLSKLKRYDIVVARYRKERIIKRIIALPNETIEIENGLIYINDRQIKDRYAYGETSDFPKIKLKANEYFLMGDNRNISKDSRIIGPVTKKNINGTTNFIIYPFNKIGKISN